MGLLLGALFLGLLFIPEVQKIALMALILAITFLSPFIVLGMVMQGAEHFPRVTFLVIVGGALYAIGEEVYKSIKKRTEASDEKEKA